MPAQWQGQLNILSKNGGHRTVLANISSILINVDELSQCLYNIDILPRPSYHQLGTFVETVIEDFKSFQNVPPVFALIIKSLIQHIHNLIKVVRSIELAAHVIIMVEAHIRVEGELSNIAHLGPRRTPGVI